MKHPGCPYIQRPYFSHAEHKLVTSILHGGFQWFKTSRLVVNELVPNTTLMPASATDRGTTQSYIKKYIESLSVTRHSNMQKKHACIYRPNPDQTKVVFDNQGKNSPQCIVAFS